MLKILNAEASVFSEEWGVPVRKDCANPYACESGCSLSSDSTHCYKYNYADKIDSIRSNINGSFCKKGHVSYGGAGTFIYDSSYLPNGTGGNPTLINWSNLFWRNYVGDTINGPVNRAGVWPCTGIATGNPTGTFIGFTVFLNVPSTKKYYVAISADNYVRLTVNHTVRFETTTNITFQHWHVLPVNLTAGVNEITLEGKNQSGPAVFATEVYDNTATEIVNAESYDDLNMIFTSKDIIGINFQSGLTYAGACPSGYTTDSSGATVRCKKYVICGYPGLGINNVINPYKVGMLGNWRAKSQYVFQVNRENLVSDPAKRGSTDIRKSGAYSSFNPFWVYIDTWVPNIYNDERWIAANEVTNFNSKGLEVENKDALNRYSSALFGYLESMPVAVASNCRYRELSFDGFEDYHFVLNCFEDTCDNSHFNFKKRLNGSTVTLTQQYSHTGKFSLAVNGSVSVSKTVYTGDPEFLYRFDTIGRFLLKSNELSKGFSPIPGKKYVLSFWVKDGSPRDPTTTVQAVINGNNLISGSQSWPIVEGWKHIETQFVLPNGATSFVLQLQSSGTVYFDDIRIHPFDGQMKSFVYDPSTQRLMAELDENNFATFYEYDDEGVLIRVKKETERGIMTIKETRSSFRKRTE